MPTIVVRGNPIHYEEQGSGAAMLLIPGTGGHTGTLAALAAEFSDAFRVIRVDRRGFGRSAPAPAQAPYVNNHVQDMAALLRALKAEPALVVGWSFGAIVALGLTIDHPELVERVVLYEPPLHAKKHMTFAMAKTMVGSILLGKVGMHRRGAARFFRWALAHRDGTDAFGALDGTMRESLLAAGRSVIAELESGTGEELTEERIATLSRPAGLVIGGRSQEIFTHAGERLARMLPRLNVVRVPDGDHLMTIGQAAALAEAVREALRTDAPTPL